MADLQPPDIEKIAVKCAFDEMVALEKIIPNEKNPNTHPAKQIDMLCKIIRAQGWRAPITISNRSGLVVRGHGRLMAAIQMGCDFAPVDYQDYANEAEEWADLVADNRLAELSVIDEKLLADLVEDIGDFDIDLDLTGFDEKAILKLLPEKKGLTDDDEIPDVPDSPISQNGDMYLMKGHRLLCGDATKSEDIVRLMDGQKADLVFSDPPYGIDVVKGGQVGGGGALKFGTIGGQNIVPSSTFKKIIGDQSTDAARLFYILCRDLKFEKIVLWGGNYFTDFLHPSRCWLIWDKQMTGNFSEAEMAWTSLDKGGVQIFKFLWNGLSREGSRADELKKRIHPTQKPVGLFVNIFNRFSECNKILDGFLGSGSTLIACEKTNRSCYGIEIDPHYCDIIVKRWQEFTGNKAELIRD